MLYALGSCAIVQLALRDTLEVRFIQLIELNHTQQVVATGEEVTLELSEEERPGYFAAVNSRGELAEVGWLKFPKLMHIGWAAQWLQYEAELQANLSKPALVVQIFKEQVPTMQMQICILLSAT